MFLEICKEGCPRAFELVDNALPKDAEIVRVGYDDNSGELLLVIWSQSYPDVPAGFRLMEVGRPIMRQVEFKIEGTEVLRQPM